jgi:hypothetical protein
LARADEQTQEYVRLARAAAEAVAEDDDRELVLADLGTIVP